MFLGNVRFSTMCSTKSKDILNIFVYTFNPMEYFKHFKNNPAVCNGSFTFPDVYILILSFHRGISIDAKWLTVCYIVWRYVVCYTSHLSIFWTSLNTYSISQVYTKEFLCQYNYSITSQPNQFIRKPSWAKNK